MECTGRKDFHNQDLPAHVEHNKPNIGSPVVVDAEKGIIYGPFASWNDAEWFSETYLGGNPNIVNLTEPNPPHIQVLDTVPQYEWNGKAWMRT